MIPFYFFRRKNPDLTASLFYSDVLDGVDYWARKDREQLIDSARIYAKYYALDWALTAGMCVLLGHVLNLLLSLAMGYEFSIDYVATITDIVVCGLVALVGSDHIINCYSKALFMKAGGGDNGL